MANRICELSIDGHDILEILDAELDNQLLRTMDEARMSVDSVLDQMNNDVKPSIEEPVPNSMAPGNSDGENDIQSCRSWTEPCVLGRRAPSSELKMTDRSFAPSPDVEMSGVNTANFAAANAITTDSATANGSTNFHKEEIPQTPVGLPVVEFGKPWKPASNGSVPIIRAEKSQQGIPQAEPGFPSRYSVSTITTKKEVNLNNIHLWRKRKEVSPLSQKTSASCNSMVLSRPRALSALGDHSFSTGAALNATGTQATGSAGRLPMMTSFGDVAIFGKDMGFNPAPSGFFPGVGGIDTSQVNKPQETIGYKNTSLDLLTQEIPDTNVYTSRQAATWERRRILVGCLSFTPSKAEVEKLFLGYNV